MKITECGLCANADFVVAKPARNNKFRIKSQNARIGMVVEGDGDWIIELPKGTASQFIGHCQKAGVGFAAITGAYSGLGFAPRDFVLFDDEFNLEQLQRLAEIFARTKFKKLK